jgi:glucosamine--fructose-6-phosphate aminotransferase (isomerizing)
VAAYLIQDWVGLPATMQVGSEMRYSPPPIDDRTLVIGVSQSGETADTLAPLRLAEERGATVVVVTNVVGSAITREADAVIYLQAGPEVAVASTKAFVTQVLVLQMLALHLARLRGTLPETRLRVYGQALRSLPRLAAETLRLAPEIKKLAQHYSRVRDFIYIGRGVGFPIAMEGALKLKELSYVHAEGYAAGELKHGPIALIDNGTPVICVLPSPRGRAVLHDKMISNIQEVRARGARVVAIAEEGDTAVAPHADHVVYVPRTPTLLAPLVTTVPLQVLAAEIAATRGHDVDQPRNLAKSVTVE